jgi:hypothetical protein
MFRSFDSFQDVVYFAHRDAFVSSRVRPPPASRRVGYHHDWFCLANFCAMA